MERRCIGPFEVQEKIAHGGMGVVYRGRCIHSNQTVALKLLPDDVTPNCWKRFERELKVLKTLRHPHIVYCYGGLCENQRRYYAMEYVENGTLRDLLSRRGLLNWDEAVTFGLQICSALDYVHARGIVHRDLKPENLLIAANGQLKLSDFGIALIADGSQLTREGSTCGSFGYMAPEQISGVQPTSASADLYALGCVLFEMVTGRRVFGDKVGPPLLLDHLRVPAPSVLKFAPDCPPALAELIAALLEKSPDDRPSDAADVSRALKSVGISSGPRNVEQTQHVRLVNTKVELEGALPRPQARLANPRRSRILVWCALMLVFGFSLGLLGPLIGRDAQPASPQPIAAAGHSVAEETNRPSLVLPMLTLGALGGLAAWLQRLNKLEATRAALECKRTATRSAKPIRRSPASDLEAREVRRYLRKLDLA